VYVGKIANVRRDGCRNAQRRQAIFARKTSIKKKKGGKGMKDGKEGSRPKDGMQSEYGARTGDANGE